MSDQPNPPTAAKLTTYFDYSQYFTEIQCHNYSSTSTICVMKRRGDFEQIQQHKRPHIDKKQEKIEEIDDDDLSSASESLFDSQIESSDELFSEDSDIEADLNGSALSGGTQFSQISQLSSIGSIDDILLSFDMPTQKKIVNNYQMHLVPSLSQFTSQELLGTQTTSKKVQFNLDNMSQSIFSQLSSLDSQVERRSRPSSQPSQDLSTPKATPPAPAFKKPAAVAIETRSILRSRPSSVTSTPQPQEPEQTHVQPAPLPQATNHNDVVMTYQSHSTSGSSSTDSKPMTEVYAPTPLPTREVQYDNNSHVNNNTTQPYIPSPVEERELRNQVAHLSVNEQPIEQAPMYLASSVANHVQPPQEAYAPYQDNAFPPVMYTEPQPQPQYSGVYDPQTDVEGYVTVQEPDDSEEYGDDYHPPDAYEGHYHEAPDYSHEHPPAEMVEGGYADDMEELADPNAVTDFGYSYSNMWGLPYIVQEIYAKRGITQFYEWQIECLSSPTLLGGRNLIYSLPTSGGKTLVAEITLLRWAILHRKKTLLVLPYVSIVTEKVKSLKEFGKRLNFTVEGYYGNHGIMPVPPGNQICICTIEKANAIVNQLIEEGRLDEIGCVVVDEVHMISDKDRGFLLELLLTKVKFVSRDSIQIVGMSATLPNLHELAEWLGGETYQGSFRPVPLEEFYKINDVVYDKNGRPQRKLPPSAAADRDHLLPLVNEVIPENSVLIFCPTKKGTQETAGLLASLMHDSVRDYKKQDKMLLFQKLKSSNSSGTIDETLRTTIPYGIAFHHSGLTVDERELIEQGFRDKIISVICCTSTLAAGVNLPARRVILRSPMMGGRYISSKDYKQMSGRAGRAGIDKFGESILVVRKDQSEMAMQLINSPLQKIASAITHSDKGFCRLVLESVGGKYARTRDEIFSFMQTTFLNKTNPDLIEQEVTKALNFLIANGFIELVTEYREDEQKLADDQRPPLPFYDVTIMGSATYRSSFSPEEAMIVKDELARSRNGLILSDDLHLCYLVTPIFNTPMPPDWNYFFTLFTNLPELRQKIGHLAGISEKFLLDKSLGYPTGSRVVTERVARRFYCALILCELIHENKVWDVAKKYRLPRGDLEALMTSASSFAQMMVSFCKRMEWWDLEALLSQYVQRLGFGVKVEILPLVEIKGVKAARARALYNAGFKSVRAIASAKHEDIMRSVKLGPFAERSAKLIIANAKKLLEKKAEELRKTAAELLGQP